MNVHVLVLPALSSAVHVTVDGPSGKEDPEDRTQVICGEESNVSETVGFAKVTWLVDETMAPGQAIVGAVWSRNEKKN